MYWIWDEHSHEHCRHTTRRYSALMGASPAGMGFSSDAGVSVVVTPSGSHSANHYKKKSIRTRQSCISTKHIHIYTHTQLHTSTGSQCTVHIRRLTDFGGDAGGASVSAMMYTTKLNNKEREKGERTRKGDTDTRCRYRYRYTQWITKTNREYAHMFNQRVCVGVWAVIHCGILGRAHQILTSIHWL